MERVRILLMCDATPEIGTGHVTRCYALAQALEDLGAEPLMSGIMEGPQWLRDLVADYWKPTALIAEHDLEAVVIDSYSHEVFERVDQLFPSIAQVHVVDDSTPVLPARAYIAPGVNVTWRPPVGDESTPSVDGAEAVLIRRELRGLSRVAPVDDPGNKLRVLLSLGGGDGYGLRGRLLNILADTRLPLRISVIGATDVPPPVNSEQEVHAIQPGSDLLRALSEADVVVSAAGVSSWECLYLGIPTALVCAVDNQRANYEFMTGQAIAVGIGATFLGEEIDEEGLARLLGSLELRKSLASRAAALVDGGGAERAAAMILSVVDRENSGTG